MFCCGYGCVYDYGYPECIEAELDAALCAGAVEHHRTHAHGVDISREGSRLLAEAKRLHPRKGEVPPTPGTLPHRVWHALAGVLPREVIYPGGRTPTLVLLRGLPGAGKSTLAARLAGWLLLPPPRAADDYFTHAGVYAFDPAGLPAAHAACQAAVAADLATHGGAVVANTFTQGWEIRPYVGIAEAAGAALVVVDLFDGGLDDEALAARGLHGVPVQAIAAMRGRYEEDWESADPRAPWLRSE